jgi:hypothetical protein
VGVGEDSMGVKAIIELPSFDTSQYEGCEFLMRNADAVLTIAVASLAPIVISFRKVRWHQFTALYNCSPDQIEGSYFVLSEVVPSAAVQEFVRSDTARAKAYEELHHFRIFLDETGCHELFAESVVANHGLEGDACKATRASS